MTRIGAPRLAPVHSSHDRMVEGVGRSCDRAAIAPGRRQSVSCPGRRLRRALEGADAEVLINHQTCDALHTERTA